MKSEVAENSLLRHLQQVEDGRRREGKIYPLGSLLGVLVLAGLNGQKTLRSMWLWCAKRWGKISRPLGFTGQAHAPSYGAVWYALHRLDTAQLEQETREWSGQVRGAEKEGWSIDGKVLRGSRREDPRQAALQVVTLVAQTLKQVIGQQSVAEGDQADATLQLLKAVPLEGKLVTLDTNLLAAMSLSRNNGRLLAEYPSVHRVLHEFDRAIALGAADQAQRLPDSFRHCIVKSWAEPPVCQCGF